MSSEIREPSCIHSEGTQPMSACSECRNHPRLQEWKDYWAARLAVAPTPEPET